MKVLPKPHRTSDTGTKHIKSSKKSKGAKKPVEKIIKDLGAKDSNPTENSTEVMLSRTQAESPSLKKVPLEIRKAEASEWKPLKKVDCLRLETVLEEGQLSSEEGISKSREECLENGSDSNVEDVERATQQSKSKFFPIAEGSDPGQEEKESEKEEEKEMLQELEEPNIRGNEKGDLEREESKLDLVTVTSSKSKKFLAPNGKVEILPIFSNDKFQCSRDAISIGECEDLCATDKNPAAFSANENRKENKFDRKNVDKNENTESSTAPKTAPAANTSILAERKLRFKAFTEKHTTKTPSHFINSLLVLAPFTEERKILLNEKIPGNSNVVEERFQTTEPSTSDIKKGPTDASFVDEEGSLHLYNELPSGNKKCTAVWFVPNYLYIINVLSLRVKINQTGRLFGMSVIHIARHWSSRS